LNALHCVNSGKADLAQTVCLNYLLFG